MKVKRGAGGGGVLYFLAYEAPYFEHRIQKPNYSLQRVGTPSFIEFSTEPKIFPI